MVQLQSPSSESPASIRRQDSSAAVLGWDWITSSKARPIQVQSIELPVLARLHRFIGFPRWPVPERATTHNAQSAGRFTAMASTRRGSFCPHTARLQDFRHRRASWPVNGRPELRTIAAHVARARVTTRAAMPECRPMRPLDQSLTDTEELIVKAIRNSRPKTKVAS